MKLKDIKQTIKEELATPQSPNQYFKLYEYLKKKLDPIAIKDGLRMSHFSQEYPTATSFYLDIKNKL